MVEEMTRALIDIGTLAKIRMRDQGAPRIDRFTATVSCSPMQAPRNSTLSFSQPASA